MRYLNQSYYCQSIMTSCLKFLGFYCSSRWMFIWKIKSKVRICSPGYSQCGWWGEAWQVVYLKLLPTFLVHSVGEIASVDGTPFDLRKPINLGEGIKKVAGPPVGYDHNFCVNASEGEKNFATRVEHSESGRVLEVFTNKPGIQLYTGNYLEGLKGKDGAVYNQHCSFALETQNYPDATNHVSSYYFTLFTQQPKQIAISLSEET